MALTVLPVPHREVWVAVHKYGVDRVAPYYKKYGVNIDCTCVAPYREVCMALTVLPNREVAILYIYGIYCVAP